MTAIFTLLPIIVFFSILIFVFYRVTRNFSKRSKLWTVKRLWIFLLIYVGVGLVIMLILAFTTDPSNVVLEQKELKAIIKQEEEILNLLLESKIDEVGSELVAREWSYNLPSDELVITCQNKEDWTLTVVVSKREELNSNEIYAKVIQIPYTIHGIDLTDKIGGRSIEFQRSELILGEREEIKLAYNQLDPSLYMIGDFRGMDLDNNDIYNYVTGVEILYLNVPEHINIIDEDEIVFYSSISK